MNRQQANAEIAKRLGWKHGAEFPGFDKYSWGDKIWFSPKGDVRLMHPPDYFQDEAAARELVQWFKLNSWPAFYEALRGILIDKTGQPVGIVDFILADPADKARAACVAFEIELEEEGK